ncbi:hypothetical protein HGB39_36695 [Rhodococcus opacus]|nr:hypothetical protein [Rhodococcus opacus]CAG7631976.1 hypothetical protein E143388_07354 [Rhodococcus opacus]
MLRPMSPTESMFLLGESRGHPMHVGGLTVFAPSEGAESADVRAMFEDAVARGEVAPQFRRRARRSVTTLGQWGWDIDTDVDLGHHVRYDTLPHPGGKTDLLPLLLLQRPAESGVTLRDVDCRDAMAPLLSLDQRCIHGR